MGGPAEQVRELLSPEKIAVDRVVDVRTDPGVKMLRAVNDAVSRPGRPPLGRANFRPRAQARVNSKDGLPQGRAHAFEIHVGICATHLSRLKTPNLAPELLALGEIGRGSFEGLFADTQHHRRDPETRPCQDPFDDRCTAVFISQQRVGRDLDARKLEQPLALPVDRPLFLNFQPRAVGRDQKDTNLLLSDRRGNQNAARPSGGRYADLFAVEAPTGAAARGAQPRTRGVRVSGLAECGGQDRTGIYDRCKPTFALCLTAERGHRHGPEDQRLENRCRCTVSAHFEEHQDAFDQAKAAPAESFGYGQGREVRRHQVAPQIFVQPSVRGFELACAFVAAAIAKYLGSQLLNELLIFADCKIHFDSSGSRRTSHLRGLIVRAGSRLSGN